MYNIVIVTDEDSWISSYALSLREALREKGHKVSWIHNFDREHSYDMVFMLSYSKIVSAKMLALNKHNLVVHESALPHGKGWSPLSWQILEGKSHFPITLFEATEQVDAGKIYLQRELVFEGTELVNELRHIQGQATVDICIEFISKYPSVLRDAQEQVGEESFYPRRRPIDSQLDVNKTISEQFDLLRIVDNNKYPAWFEHRGKKYVIKIEHM